MDQRTLLLTAFLAAGTFVHAQQLQLDARPVDFTLSGDRGTDTLFTTGVATTPAFYSYAIQGGGYLMGPNALGITQIAQEFELFGEAATVDGIVFIFGNVTYGGSPSSHVKARLFAMNGTGGQTTAGPAARPNTVLAEVQLPLSNVAEGEFSGVSFAPVWVNGSFAAGFSLNGLATGDTLNLFATEAGYVELDDKSWFNVAGATWATYKFLGASQPTPVDINVDLMVGAVLTFSSVGVESNSWLNGMQMDLLGGNPNRDAFTVRYALREAADMRLYVIDASGRPVVDEFLGRRTDINQHEVNTQGWAPGIYFVNLLANGRPITKKLVVE